MSLILKGLTRFYPWLTLTLVYLALGMVGRLVLWARFGIEADVAISQLPYVAAAGSDARTLPDLLEEFEALRRATYLLARHMPEEGWARRATTRR